MTKTNTKIKSAMVRARIEPGLKTKAEKYFDILGLSTTQAITLFFKQVELHAMKEIENGGGRKFKNTDELFKHLGI